MGFYKGDLKIRSSQMVCLWWHQIRQILPHCQFLQCFLKGQRLIVHEPHQVTDEKWPEYRATSSGSGQRTHPGERGLPRNRSLKLPSMPSEKPSSAGVCGWSWSCHDTGVRLTHLKAGVQKPWRSTEWASWVRLWLGPEKNVESC